MTRRRRSRSPQSILAGLVLLLLIAIAYALFPDVFGGPLGAAATPAPVVENVVAGAWYSLYFTTPESTAGLDNPTGGIPARVAATIDAAQRSVDVAMYEFDLMPLADALLRADRRGVQVRVVTDTDSLGEPPVQALQDAGIPVVGDGREPIMHNKFVILDGAAVWTGSMNFTRNDAYRNDNNFIHIQSTRLAENYTREFEEMFLRGAFGPTSPADTPHPRITLDGTLIENYFSPDDGVAARVLELLQGADESVYFMAFSFTRLDFAQALLDRAAAGVTVQGVLETRQIAAGGDQAWQAFTQGGLANFVRQDGNRYNLHSKVFIIDGETVVTGSYNFSRNAEERNDENVLIIHSPEIAAAYFADWQRVWAQAGD